MKRLKLSLQNIEGAEVLSREQLKKILGGDGGSGSGGGTACVSCPEYTGRGVMCGGSTCIAQQEAYQLQCWSSSCDCWTVYSCYS